MISAADDPSRRDRVGAALTRIACLTAVLLSGLGPCPAVSADAPVRYRALLVAADGSLPVFDNAVRRLAHDIAPRADVRVLSARASGGAQATLAATLAAIAELRPAPHEGCLLYVTSHGARDAGLVFDSGDEVLSAADLSRALARGCGTAPTVVVLSGCYSGMYARAPVAGRDRIVITAARADRPSFGCGAGDVYTVFDQCLLGAIEAGGNWRDAFGATRACVASEESREQQRPSDPQASFGADAAGLKLP